MTAPINYLSVCSGIEAASTAWCETEGFNPVAFSEIEEAPCAVLRHHYPHVPNLGDMTQIDGRDYHGLVDLLVGGTPCQAFSKAGLRNGLHDERGNLTLHYVRLVDEIDPQLGFVWENVPGVLSDHTNAFGCLIGYLAGDDDPATPGDRPAEGKSSQFWQWSKKHSVHVPKWPPSGWVVGPKRTIAWRVCDAQWHGVAQRRSRVFVVGCPRTGKFDPRDILFEPEGRQWDPPARPQRPEALAIAARLGLDGSDDWPPECAGTLYASYGTKWGNNDDFVTHKGALYTLAFGGNNTTGPIDITPALTTNRGTHNPGDFEAGTLLVAFPGNMSSTQVAAEGDICPALGAKNPTAVAYVKGTNPHSATEAPKFTETDLAACLNGWDERHDPPKHLVVGFGGRDNGKDAAYDIAPTMRSHNSVGSNQSSAWSLAVAYVDFYNRLRVRRLTPTECETLMGFAKDYTLVPWKRGKLMPDGLRYKMLGNSMVVDVMRWLGVRIMQAWRGAEW